MCLIVFAWQAHPRYDLIVAANRDEFHERPTRAAHWWPDAPTVYGGRDERAGGAWCAADHQGRFAAVTNVRESAQQTERCSRGALVHDALVQQIPFDRQRERIAGKSRNYGPFNLLLADSNTLYFLSNRGDRQELAIPPGIHAISNGCWGEHWPKTDRAESQLKALLEADNVSPAALFELLGESEPAPAEALPDTGVGPNTEQLLSSLFVRSPYYGTRASTLVLRDYNGRIDFHERGFDHNAEMTSVQHEHWSIA